MGEYEYTISVIKGSKKTDINVDDILAIVADRNYVDVYCNFGTFLLRETMKNLEASFARRNFIRTHRSAIVRKSSIAAIRKLSSGNGSILLTNGVQVPASKNFMLSVEFKELVAV